MHDVSTIGRGRNAHPWFQQHEDRNAIREARDYASTISRALRFPDEVGPTPSGIELVRRHLGQHAIRMAKTNLRTPAVLISEDGRNRILASPAFDLATRHHAIVTVWVSLAMALDRFDSSSRVRLFDLLVDELLVPLRCATVRHYLVDGVLTTESAAMALEVPIEVVERQTRRALSEAGAGPALNMGLVPFAPPANRVTRSTRSRKAVSA